MFPGSVIERIEAMIECIYALAQASAIECMFISAIILAPSLTAAPQEP